MCYRWLWLKKGYLKKPYWEKDIPNPVFFFLFFFLGGGEGKYFLSQIFKYGVPLF